MRALLLAGIISILTITAHAAERVDVALVLLSDVSRSVDDGEFQLEKEGYASALQDACVLAAIQSGTAGAIAVAYVEFAGPDQVSLVLDWNIVRGATDAQGFAEALLAAHRTAWGRTAIGAGIDFAAAQLARAPVQAGRQIIDVAGDGTSNAGRDVSAARDAAVAAGITINGLAIVNEHPMNMLFAHVQPPGGLPAWYAANVTGGLGSFVLEVRDFQAFRAAMTRKLVSEIASR